MIKPMSNKIKKLKSLKKNSNNKLISNVTADEISNVNDLKSFILLLIDKNYLDTLL